MPGQEEVRGDSDVYRHFLLNSHGDIHFQSFVAFGDVLKRESKENVDIFLKSEEG